jgi:hypothetical protein
MLPPKFFLLPVLSANIPNPDKPKEIATKAPRHKAKPLVNIHLCVFVTWWRKFFTLICTEFTIKRLNHNAYLLDENLATRLELSARS